MKKVFLFLHVVIFTAFFFSCKKGSEVSSASAQIQIDRVVLSTNTKLSVFVSLKGSFTQATERGICWDKTINPTVRNNKKINTQIGNQFTDSLSLLPSTKYYVRAYLALGKDTIYSDNATITTKKIEIIFDKQYPVDENAPNIMGVVGNELEGFTICSSMSHVYGSGYFQRLTKIDGDGNLLWTRDYDDGKSKEPRVIRKLPDGYLIGSNYWKTSDVSVVLRKFDLNGNFVWEHEFKKDVFQFLVQLSLRNNSFLVTMRAYNTPFMTDPSRKVSLWDFTVDNNGTVLSEKEYPNFTLLDGTNINYHVIGTPDKGFFSYSDIGYSNENADVLAHLFTPQYTLKWRKIYETPLFETATTATTAPNGNYVIAGYRYDAALKATAGFVFEVDKENGNYIWQNFYEKPSIGNYYSLMEIMQHNGRYYMGSTVSSTLFISRLDAFGKIDWEYAVAPKTGFYAVTAKNIYIAANDDIYVFGMRRNTQNGTNPPELFMIKMKE